MSCKFTGIKGFSRDQHRKILNIQGKEHTNSNENSVMVVLSIEH